MGSLEDGDEEDWILTLIKVMFIGEDGIDSGGLTRFFFLCYLKQLLFLTKTFFSIKPELLAKKTYYLIGKALAKALNEFRSENK